MNNFTLSISGCLENLPLGIKTVLHSPKDLDVMVFIALTVHLSNTCHRKYRHHVEKISREARTFILDITNPQDLPKQEMMKALLLSLATKVEKKSIRWSTCFIMTTEDGDKTVVSVFNNTKTNLDEAVDFAIDTQYVVIDNCATHHICNDLTLFDLPPALCHDIVINGATGTGSAAAIGNVTITIRDDNKIKHAITLQDVIYLPECSKTIISTSKWSDDRADDCCVISRSSYSIFFWDDDTHHKFVLHSIHMKIPLMPINEERKRTEENVSALFTHIPSCRRFTNANSHTDSPETAQQPVNDDTFVSTTPTILLSNKPASEDAKLALYWHYQLDHAPLLEIRRLSQRGDLPYRLSKVYKMPPCTACELSNAHRKRWTRNREGARHILGMHWHKPGGMVSCDHLI